MSETNWQNKKTIFIMANSHGIAMKPQHISTITKYHSLIAIKTLKTLKIPYSLILPKDSSSILHPPIPKSNPTILFMFIQLKILSCSSKNVSLFFIKNLESLYVQNSLINLDIPIDHILHVYHHSINPEQYILIIQTQSSSILIIINLESKQLIPFSLDQQQHQILSKSAIFYIQHHLFIIHSNILHMYSHCEPTKFISTMQQPIHSDHYFLIPLQSSNHSYFHFLSIDRIAQKQEKDNQIHINTLSIQFTMYRVHLLDQPSKIKLLFQNHQYDSLKPLLNDPKDNYLIEALLLTSDKKFIKQQLKQLYISKIINLHHLKSYYKNAKWKILDSYQQSDIPFEDLFNITKMYHKFDHPKLISYFQHHLLQNLPFLYFHLKGKNLLLQDLLQDIPMQGQQLTFLSKSQLNDFKYLNTKVYAQIPEKPIFYYHLAQLDRILFGITSKTEQLLIEGEVTDELLYLRLFKLKTIQYQSYEESFDLFKNNPLLKVINSCPTYQQEELLNDTLPSLYNDLDKYQQEIIKIYEEGNDNEDLFVTLFEQFVPNDFLFNVFDKIVFDRYYCSHFLLLNRICKFIPKFEALAEMAEILNNFHMNNSIKDLQFRIQQSQMEPLIETIIQNHLIRRQRTNLMAYGDELYDLDDPHEFIQYLKVTFPGNGKVIETTLFEKYIDYNKFKILKQIIKSLTLEANDYDQLLYKTLTKTLQQTKQLEQIDDFIKQLLEIFEQIKKMYSEHQFPYTKKKLNILKILKFIRIWNLDQSQLDWRKCLEIQDVPQCNAIIHNLIQSVDQQSLLEIPFIKLKHKLIKSFCSQKQILEYVYDKDFCQMMMNLASIYIEKGLVERAQRMFNTLFENAPPGDTLANISLKLMQYDQTKLEYFRKGLEMAKSPDSVCSLIDIMKQNQSKKGSVFETLTSNLKQDIQDQFNKRKVKIIDSDLIEHPLKTKQEKRKFKGEFRKLYVQLETIMDQKYHHFINFFLQEITKDYKNAFNILRHQMNIQHYEIIIAKIVSTQLFKIDLMLLSYIKCYLTQLPLEQLQQHLQSNVTKQVLVSPQFFLINKYHFKDPLNFIKQINDAQLVKLTQSYILSKSYSIFKIGPQDLEHFFFDRTFRNAYLTDKLAKEPNLIIPELHHFKDFNINEIMFLHLVQIAKKMNLSSYFIEEDKQTRVYNSEGKSSWKQDLVNQIKRIQGEYFDKLIQKLNDPRIIWGLYEIFQRNLIIERFKYQQYLLIRGLIKQSILDNKDEYNVLLDYIINKTLLGKNNIKGVNIENLIDHNNLFILQKLLVELELAKSQQDVILIYFKKISIRILKVNENEQKDFDFKILSSWITNCKDQQKVNELREQMHDFIQNDCDEETAKFIMQLLQ